MAGCVGETEFVNGIAAAGVSGIYGNCTLCAGIVSTADCLLGAVVLEPILQAHIAGTFARWMPVLFSPFAMREIRSVDVNSMHGQLSVYVYAYGNAASSRFRGIRVLGYDFKSIAPDPRFAEAMGLLEKYDLTFDVGGETHALEDVVLLAKTYPRVYDASSDPI
jgi:hypothetical protein